jgi:RNA polymerase sigma-70 factor (ECF subfamily)
MSPDEIEEKADLSRRVREGDAGALEEAFARHAERLRRMVRLRLDRALRGRVRDSEVIEVARVEASRGLPEYLEGGDQPVFLWLRSVVGRVLVGIHGKLLGSAAKDRPRTVLLSGRPMPEVKSTDLAAQLLGKQSFGSIEALQTMERRQLEDALDAMDERDREVLILRHFERLSNAETARELGIAESSASKRYIHALLELKAMEGILQRVRRGMDPA